MLGWVQLPGGARFLLEPPQMVGVVRKRSGQDFDGHLAPYPRVAGAIHLAHAPGAEGGEDS